MKIEDIIIGIIVGIAIGYMLSKAQNVRLAVEPNLPVVNEERWAWTDYKGNKRDIVVHRKVKEEVIVE